jgi:hypothetical protein
MYSLYMLVSSHAEQPVHYCVECDEAVLIITVVITHIKHTLQQELLHLLIYTHCKATLPHILCVVYYTNALKLYYCYCIYVHINTTYNSKSTCIWRSYGRR